jgi:hypothetical protein
MAPVAVSSPAPTVESIKAGLAATTLDAPQVADLRAYSHFDSTPATGTEFRAEARNGAPALKIRDVLASEAKLRALGRLVSERGVVFFREAEITPEEQKTLVSELGRLGGKPETSGLHVHPLTLPNQRDGDEITVISNQFVFGDKFKRRDNGVLERPTGQIMWVSTLCGVDGVTSREHATDS